MADIVDKSDAIAAVTSLLATTLSKSGVEVKPGKPVRSTDGVFLYLYGVHVDEHLRNTPLDQGQEPPLWLVLKYFISVVESGQPGSLTSLGKLGNVLREIHTHQHLVYDPAIPIVGYPDVLDPVCQEFKISIEELSVDTVSRILSSTESFYSCGIGLQLRPLPIFPNTLPRFSQLVGVDYSRSPSGPRTEAQGDGRSLSIAMGLSPAMLISSEPVLIEAGASVILRGARLAQGLSDNAVVEVEGAPFPIQSWSENEIRVVLSEDILADHKLSAGILEARIKYNVPGSNAQYSNSIPLRFIPTVTEASQGLADSIFGDYLRLTLKGHLLGQNRDQVSVALLRGGNVAAASTRVEFTAEEGDLYQSEILAHFEGPQNAISRGEALILVRVNGQQAMSSITYEV